MKNLFITIIIGVLLVLLVLSRCNSVNTNSIKIDTVTSVDTIYRNVDVVTTKYNVITKIIEKPSKERIDSFYKPSNDCDSLKLQYKEAIEKYISYSVVEDTIHIDSLGFVSIKDSISENQIKMRSTRASFKIPEVFTTTTITKVLPVKRQVYIGGEVVGNSSEGVNGANGILMYKDRHDRAFQLKAGAHIYNNKVFTGFGIGMLWKIKFN